MARSNRSDRAGPHCRTLAGMGLLVLALASPGCVIEPARPVVLSPPPHRSPPPSAPPPSWPEPPPVYRQPSPEPDGPRAMRGIHVPPDRVPREGSCAVWFADIPPDRQPPAMSCIKARRDAGRWGGWVIWARGPESFRDGHVNAEDFGPHQLHGVPPDRLPPPGWCRLWYDGTAPDRQPQAAPCATVLQQRHEGGRVLYMPGSDLRR